MVIFVGPRVEDQLCSPCVELEPYAHQVGGHVSVLALDKHTVCKPHIHQEHQFYQELPPNLSKFVPKFKGVADVVVKQDRDGYMNLVAFPQRARSLSYDMSQKHVCTEGKESWNGRSGDEDETRCSFACTTQPRSQIRKPLYRVRLANGGNLSIDEDSDSDDLFEDMSTESGYRRFGCNPWSMHCHRQQIAKMKKEQEVSQSHKFLLLENVTDQFEHPCILDLKIGLRSYGDDATEEKKRSHKAKIQGTTSAKLGVRVCGMQIYRPDKERFICRNKYYGRRLSEEGLRQAVEEFVFNGCKLRIEVVLAIMKEIKDLIKTLSELDSYRFFGSSLLLIYEGSDTFSEKEEQRRLSMEDKAFSLGKNAHFKTVETKVNAATQTEQPFVCHDGELQRLPKGVELHEDNKSSGSDSVMGSDSDVDSLLGSCTEEDAEAADMEGRLRHTSCETLRSSMSSGDDAFKSCHHPLDHSMGWDETGDWETQRQQKRTDLSSSPFDAIPDYSKSPYKKMRRSSKQERDICKESKLAGQPLVQIKMIDFAHTEFRESKIYKGPDTDFTYGLENLLRIFAELLSEEMDVPGGHEEEAVSR